MTVKFKNQYQCNSKVKKYFTEPSLTDQSFKNECDLGFIVENYVSKGIPLPASNMQYGDCTTVQEFQEAQLLVADAKSNFEQLPSKERDRFKTVENYLDFISKAENIKESYEKGYIDRGSVDLIDVYPERFGVSSSEVTDSTVADTSQDVPAPPAKEE